MAKNAITFQTTFSATKDQIVAAVLRNDTLKEMVAAELQGQLPKTKRGRSASTGSGTRGKRGAHPLAAVKALIAGDATSKGKALVGKQIEEHANGHDFGNALNSTLNMLADKKGIVGYEELTKAEQEKFAPARGKSPTWKFYLKVSPEKALAAVGGAEEAAE